MSPLGFVATLAAGGTIGAMTIAMTRAAHDCLDSFVCAMCRDTGVHVLEVPHQAPAKVWCRACELGRRHAARAAAARSDRARVDSGPRAAVIASLLDADRAPVELVPLKPTGMRHYATDPRAATAPGMYLARARCGAWLATPAGVTLWELDTSGIVTVCPQCEAAS